MRRRRLGPPRVMTGAERRRINPNSGLIKLLEHHMDVVVSRFLYPHLSRVWNPYGWLLRRRFVLTEVALAPARWPTRLAPLRVLLISDIHTGIFLRPHILAEVVEGLMTLAPDLVAIAGDVVTGHSSEVRPFLHALAPLSRAPLGAWYAHGNHDYFGGDPAELREDLGRAGITTLHNASLALKHGPDHFYEAEHYGVPLTLSGHTHGGQIRLPGGPPIIRHSRFCLDEGVYAFRSSLLVVSRGLGSVGLPWRWGADPEAILLEIGAR